MRTTSGARAEVRSHTSRFDTGGTMRRARPRSHRRGDARDPASGPLSSAGAVRRREAPAASCGSPYDLTGLGGDQVGPDHAVEPRHWYVQRWIYDSLIRQNADGAYSPGLAKSATVDRSADDRHRAQPEHEVLRRHPDGRRRGEVQHRADHGLRERRRGAGRAATKSRAITVNSPTKFTSSSRRRSRASSTTCSRTARRSSCRPPRCRAARPSTRSRWARARSLLESFTPEGRRSS